MKKQASKSIRIGNEISMDLFSKKNLENAESNFLAQKEIDSKKRLELLKEEL